MKKDKNKEVVADKAKAVPQVDTLKQEKPETLQITLTKEEKDILFDIWKIHSLMRTGKALAEYYEESSDPNWFDVITLMTIGQEKVQKIIDVFEEKEII